MIFWVLGGMFLPSADCAVSPAACRPWLWGSDSPRSSGPGGPVSVETREKNQHPPLPFRDMLRGVVSKTKSTHLLDQVQTLAVVHPVDVSPHQTFPAGGEGSGRSSQFVNNLLQ